MNKIGFRLKMLKIKKRNDSSDLLDWIVNFF